MRDAARTYKRTSGRMASLYQLPAPRPACAARVCCSTQGITDSRQGLVRPAVLLYADAALTDGALSRHLLRAEALRPHPATCNSGLACSHCCVATVRLQSMACLRYLYESRTQKRCSRPGLRHNGRCRFPRVGRRSRPDHGDYLGFFARHLHASPCSCVRRASRHSTSTWNGSPTMPARVESGCRRHDSTCGRSTPPGVRQPGQRSQDR